MKIAVDPQHPLQALPSCSQHLNLIRNLIASGLETVDLDRSGTVGLYHVLSGVSEAIDEVEARMRALLDQAAERPQLTEPAAAPRRHQRAA